MGWAKGILMKKQVVQNLASIRADVLSYYGGGGGGGSVKPHAWTRGYYSTLTYG